MKSIVACLTFVNFLLVQGESFVLSASSAIRQREHQITTISSLSTCLPPRKTFLLSQRGGGEEDSIVNHHDNDNYNSDDNPDENDGSKQKKNHIQVSSTIDLPFSAEIAFDAFSNLPRQASWSPWLKSVEYIDEASIETKWTMQSILGISYSWNAISTRLERPQVIEWESTKGLRNWGKVKFIPQSKDVTSMQLTLTFVAPRIVARFFRKRDGGLSRMVQTRIVGRTLRNFRRVVLAEDVKALNEKHVREEESVELEMSTSS